MSGLAGTRSYRRCKWRRSGKRCRSCHNLRRRSRARHTSNRIGSGRSRKALGRCPPRKSAPNRRRARMTRNSARRPSGPDTSCHRQTGSSGRPPVAVLGIHPSCSCSRSGNPHHSDSQARAIGRRSLPRQAMPARRRTTTERCVLRGLDDSWLCTLLDSSELNRAIAGATSRSVRLTAIRGARDRASFQQRLGAFRAPAALQNATPTRASCHRFAPQRRGRPRTMKWKRRWSAVPLIPRLQV
jgi:hypothetical protein